jgi:hypothetical protein
MIAVIADDFSGAAEIAGIGLDHGLSCEVHTGYRPVHPELLIVDSHTRTCTEEDAAATVKRIAGKLSSGAEWIYKKTDSVFRGHVAAEIEAIMKVLSKGAALLMPANPSMGRKIHNGIYTVNDVPLSETHFAHDPESAVQSSDVVKLLDASESIAVNSRVLSQGIAKSGITIGNAATVNEVRAWADVVGESLLPAGGSEFFGALLQARGYRRKSSGKTDLRDLKDGKTMILRGARNREIPGIGRRGDIISMIFPVQREADLNTGYRRKWVEQISAALKRERTVAVGFHCALKRTPVFTAAFLGFTAGLVSDIIRGVGLLHLMIEGGTTASAIVRTMKWHTWIPVRFIRIKTDRETGQLSVAAGNRISHSVIQIVKGVREWPNKASISWTILSLSPLL